MIGGAAISLGLTYAMNTSWGFSRSRTSVALLVSGLWNNFAKLGLPVLALALLALSAPPSAGRIAAGLAGLAALVARRRPARRAAAQPGGRRADRHDRRPDRLGAAPPVRPGAGDRLGPGDDEVPRPDGAAAKARWQWITLATVVSHLSLFLVLLLALRFVGVDPEQVSTVEALAVFAFARLLTAIPFTPGGLGVIELALITGLAAAGGPRALVAAAVLVFRALTYVLPIPIGIGTYLFWRHNRSWRREPNTAPRTELVPESV